MNNDIVWWNELTKEEQWKVYLEKSERLKDLEEEIDYRDQRAEDLCSWGKDTCG